MGVTNYLLIADAADAQRVAAHDAPSRQWDGPSFRGLDRIKLVALWALIEAGSVEDRFDERMDAIETITQSEKGP